MAKKMRATVRKYTRRVKGKRVMVRKHSRGVKGRFAVKKVPGSFKLPIQTATLIPSTRGESVPVSRAQFQSRVTEARRFLSRLFGGYTSVRAVGGFVSKGRVIREQVAVVTAYASRDAFRKNKARWLSWVRQKKRAWGQESMGIIIEGDMFWI